MRDRERRLVGAGLVLLVMALPIRADILEQILVKVNGEIFTKTDLEQRQIAYLRRSDPRFNAETLENDEELKKVLAEVTPRILVEAVDELLVMQQGKSLGYQLADDQFQTVIENIKKENEIESDEQFETALEQEGMTMADLRRSLERQMLVSRVQQVEVLSKLTVTEPEQREYYDSHLDEFSMPPSVTIREILISAPAEDDATEAGEPRTGQSSLSQVVAEQAGQKAEAARSRILAGEAFDAVVAEMSDAPSKANGGLIGPVDPDELAPALRSVVAQLQVGEVSEIVRTARGYQFFRLETAATDSHRSFEDVREEIAKRVYGEKGDVEYQRLIDRLRSEAIIDWKNPDLQKAYLQQLQAGVAASSS